MWVELKIVMDVILGRSVPIIGIGQLLANNKIQIAGHSVKNHWYCNVLITVKQKTEIIKITNQQKKSKG